jgi:hypothetical protein
MISCYKLLWDIILFMLQVIELCCYFHVSMTNVMTGAHGFVLCNDGPSYISKH